MTDAEVNLAIAGIDVPIINALKGMGYFSQPASKGHHLACEGGLAKHSANVTERLVELTKALNVKWFRDQAPYIVGMMHDLVKCRCYKMKGRDAEGRGIDVRYDEYVEIGPARYCPKCYVRQTESEGDK